MTKFNSKASAAPTAKALQ